MVSYLLTMTNLAVEFLSLFVFQFNSIRFDDKRPLRAGYVNFIGNTTHCVVSHTSLLQLIIIHTYHNSLKFILSVTPRFSSSTYPVTEESKTVGVIATVRPIINTRANDHGKH